MLKKNKIKWMAALAMTIASASIGVQAQEQAPIRIIIGFAAGGNGDLIARMMADELRPILGRSVIVENRPGALGRLAAQALKASPGDGTSYLLAPDSWAIFPTILNTEAQLRYSYHQDFTPVARIATYPLGFFVSEKLEVNTLSEYVEKAKRDPSIAMYGSSGSGGITEFLGTVLSKEFGFKMSQIPFKGGGEIKTNLMGGQLSAGIMTPGDGLSEVGTRIKPLGFLVEDRWEVAPNVPTFKEQGFNVTTGGAFSGFWTTSKTPEVEWKKMESALQQVLSKSHVKEKLANIYVKADFADGKKFGNDVNRLIQYWTPITQESSSAFTK